MSKLSSKRLVVTAVPFIVMVFGTACDDLPDQPDPIEQGDGGSATEPLEESYGDASAAEGTKTETDAGTHSLPIDAGNSVTLIDANMQNVPVDAGPELSTYGKIYALIATHCVSCHAAGKTLDMSTPQMAHAQLVGVPAGYKACAATDGGTAALRVVAGSPESSLLIAKLEGHQTCGKQMPIAALLPSESIALFRAWIAAGAPAD